MKLDERQAGEAGDILFSASSKLFISEPRIIFYSAGVQPVRLAVFDMNGRLIELLAEGMLERGYHEFTSIPENRKEGFYILRLGTPGSVMVRKIISIRLPFPEDRYVPLVLTKDSHFRRVLNAGFMIGKTE